MKPVVDFATVHDNRNRISSSMNKLVNHIAIMKNMFLRNNLIYIISAMKTRGESRRDLSHRSTDDFSCDDIPAPGNIAAQGVCVCMPSDRRKWEGEIK